MRKYISILVISCVPLYSQAWIVFDVGHFVGLFKDAILMTADVAKSIEKVLILKQQVEQVTQELVHTKNHISAICGGDVRATLSKIKGKAYHTSLFGNIASTMQQLGIDGNSIAAFEGASKALDTTELLKGGVGSLADIAANEAKGLVKGLEVNGSSYTRNGTPMAGDAVASMLGDVATKGKMDFIIASKASEMKADNYKNSLDSVSTDIDTGTNLAEQAAIGNSLAAMQSKILADGMKQDSAAAIAKLKFEEAVRLQMEARKDVERAKTLAEGIYD